MQKNKPFLLAKYYLVDSNLNRIKSDWVTSSIMTWLQDKKKITFKKNHYHFSRSFESRCTTTLKQKATRWILAKGQQHFWWLLCFKTSCCEAGNVPAAHNQKCMLKFHWQTAQRRKPQTQTDFTVSITSPASYPAVLASIFRSQAALISKRLYKWTYLALKQVESFHIVLIGLYYTPKNKGYKIGVS